MNQFTCERGHALNPATRHARQRLTEQPVRGPCIGTAPTGKSSPESLQAQSEAVAAPTHGNSPSPEVSLQGWGSRGGMHTGDMRRAPSLVTDRAVRFWLPAIFPPREAEGFQKNPVAHPGSAPMPKLISRIDPDLGN